MKAGLKIAIILPVFWHASDPSQSSIDIGLYVKAIRGLGHEPVVVCREDSEFTGVDHPVLAISIDRMSDVDYWREQKIDVAVVFTWLKHASILKALDAAGTYTISRADSDGIFSARVFPLPMISRILGSETSLFAKARALKHWAYLNRRGYWITDAEALESIAASPIVAIETKTGHSNLLHFLRYYGRGDLIDRIVVYPHLVSDDLLAAPLVEKQNRIVAIGRWDSWQKDGRLLAGALRRYLGTAATETEPPEVKLIGRGGEALFSALRQQYPTVQYLGPISHDRILEALSPAKVLLVSSRWESFHIAAHEALCCGATVVGPPDVVPIPDVCAEGRFGTMAASRRPQALGDALTSEMEHWKNGKRDPARIASHWRPYLSPDRVVGEMFETYLTHLRGDLRPKVADLSA